MCGIAGVFVSKTLDDAQRRAVHRIREHQLMRGSDQTGEWTSDDGRVLFAHNLLAIQDAAERGRQPLCFEHLAIVLNGEIYNFRDIQRHLRSEGYDFNTGTDTEVALKAYHRWGKEAVPRFNGEFAFAVWDGALNELFIARDRFGMKPLYYHIGNGEFWFGSFLPSLVKNIGVPTSIDTGALHCYFTMEGVIPPPLTPFNEFRKLPQAHYGIVTSAEGTGRIDCRMERYYRTPIAQSLDPRQDESTVIESVRETLIASVESRLISGVDVAIWLSGGLDSSLITGIVTKELGKRVRTFSIGFEDMKGERGNEFAYSRYVAKECGTDHEELFESGADIERSVPDCLTNVNEPMMSNDLIGHYLLARHTSKRGIKVTISGLAGDEMWYGYDWHRRAAGARTDGISLFEDIFCERSNGELKTILRAPYFNDDFSRRFLRDYFGGIDGSAFELVIRGDIEIIMIDDPVKRADSAGMRYAVETRAPFLDHEFVDYGMSLPLNVKFKDGIGKYVLKKISERYFENRFVHREKGYFVVPLVKHTVGGMKSFCLDVLGSERCRRRGVFDVRFLDGLEDREEYVTPSGGNLLWQSTCWEAWLQQFD